MSIPFFYIKEYDSSKKSLRLDEDTSRHVIQVLRMKKGERLQLTDGNGNLLTAEIDEEHKKHCLVTIVSTTFQEKNSKNVSIGISLLKNANRFEWFLEKATELGVAEIIPLLCERTEKEKFRHDRMQQICISAMLQSQQVWLPQLRMPEEFENIISEDWSGLRLIAHCIENEKKGLAGIWNSFGAEENNVRILVGPEGDFSANEVDLAIKNKFIAVSLGDTRLRTETAGVATAVLLCIGS
jgi:16S rRNA (uracil1498-N3)-methyltransferase